MPVRPILTVTLNPALDVTTAVDRLVPQQKLRCDAPRYDPGGGGVNVSRAIRILGGASRAFVALAGATGAQYRALLDELGIDAELRSLRGETRTSLIVRERQTGEHYRFVLPGPEQTAEEVDPLVEDIATLASPDGFVVVSGSLPPGLPADSYARLTLRLRGKGARVILDASGDCLKQSLSARPYLLRLNHLEAAELVGSGTGPLQIARSARALLEAGAAEVVIVTLGADGAFVAGGSAELHIQPPRVVVNSALGGGDSFVGALALALARGWTVPEAARLGVAAAASAVSTPSNQLCEYATTYDYLRQTTVAPAEEDAAESG